MAAPYNLKLGLSNGICVVFDVQRGGNLDDERFFPPSIQTFDDTFFFFSSPPSFFSFSFQGLLYLDACIFMCQGLQYNV